MRWRKPSSEESASVSDLTLALDPTSLFDPKNGSAQRLPSRQSDQSTMELMAGVSSLDVKRARQLLSHLADSK